MKALLISPDDKVIEQCEVASLDEIKQLIGYDTVISDEIGPDGDRLFFDEECFLRGTPGRFQIDSVIPVSGKGVIVSAGQDGAVLKDVCSTSADIEARLKYL